MYYYQQTGELKLASGQLLYMCYSGHGEGKNNPDMQHIKRVGPIPKGKYIIGPVYDSSRTGPYTIKLTPYDDNEMFGRSAFRIHGDSIKQPGTASTGCIIAPRHIRESIILSGDKELTVI